MNLIHGSNRKAHKATAGVLSRHILLHDHSLRRKKRKTAAILPKKPVRCHTHTTHGTMALEQGNGSQLGVNPEQILIGLGQRIPMPGSLKDARLAPVSAMTAVTVLSIGQTVSGLN
jgi:hypothetical protein